MNPEVTITVSGPVGSAKSALLGEIEIMLKALGVPVRYADEKAAQAEKNGTHCDWTSAIEMYTPSVVLVEALAATIQEPVMVAEPVGESFSEKLAREMREGTAVFVSASKPAAPMVADPAGAAEPGEIDLIALLENCKPNYGDVGSRDIDVASKRIAIDEAIRRLRIAGPQFTAAKYLAATVKAVPSEALDKAVRALEGYAASYDLMSRMGDGKVNCTSVKYDISKNMVDAVKRAFAAPLADKTEGAA